VTWTADSLLRFPLLFRTNVKGMKGVLLLGVGLYVIRIVQNFFFYFDSVSFIYFVRRRGILIEVVRVRVCARRTNSRSPKFLPSSWTDMQRIKFAARRCSLDNSLSTATRLQTLQNYINPQTMKFTHVTLMNSVNTS
jgi:hypothetical protein